MTRFARFAQCRLLPGLICVWSLAACSDRQSASVSAIPDKNPALYAFIPGGMVDTCGLLASAEIAALLGDGFTAKNNVVLAANDPDQFQKSGDCRISASKAASRVYFAVFVGKDQAVMDRKYQNGQWAADHGQVMPGLKTEEVSGVGSRAYAYHFQTGKRAAGNDFTLVAQAGQKLVTVTLQDFPPLPAEQLPKARDLGARLLAKL